MTPIPCLPASVMPDGLICEATANGISSCNGSSCSAASLQREPVAFVGDALAAHQPADDADRLVLAVALHHRVDAERVRVRGQRPRPGAEDRPPAGHVVELHHALRDIERVVIGQRDDAGGELDALRALAGRGEEHLGRGDHLPAARMVLAAPELVIAEPVELLDKVEIAAELQHRMLADRMMRREKGAEAKTGHEDLLVVEGAAAAGRSANLFRGLWFTLSWPDDYGALSRSPACLPANAGQSLTEARTTASKIRTG